MSDKDGGAAFPTSFPFAINADAENAEEQFKEARAYCRGMTLRDYFAAKAMQGMLPMDSDNGRYRDASNCSRTAELAYAMADAMLKERAK